MKKLLLSLSLFASFSAFSATTGTLLLTGFIPQVINIVVTAAPVSTALALATSQTNLVVASVNESSNSSTGYKVTFNSANLGKLKRTSGTEVFPYTMRYNGIAVGLTIPTVFTTTSTVPANVNKNIDISYVGVPNVAMVSGTYSDVVTLTIAAN